MARNTTKRLIWPFIWRTRVALTTADMDEYLEFGAWAQRAGLPMLWQVTQQLKREKGQGNGTTDG
jgi:hypothetical protein